MVSFTAYGVVSELCEKTASSSRLPCQIKSTTFEKVNNYQLLREAQELFLEGNYKIKSDIEYTIYSNSHLKYILSKDDFHKMITNTIVFKNHNQIENSKKVLIDTYIYENDKEDKGKKNKKAKLYAGYVVMDFRLDNKSVYKIQVDYMDVDIKDLKNRVDCAIQSFITL